MALSVPVNGLKEGDKEPVIELFVKVKAGGVVARLGAERAASPTVGRPLPQPPFSRLEAGGDGGGLQVFLSDSLGAASPRRTGSGGTGHPLPHLLSGLPSFLPPPPNSLRPGARRDGGCLLTAAPGSAVGDASSFGSVRGGWVRKGPSVGEGLRGGVGVCVCVRSGEGVRGTGGESVCTDEGSVAANRK